MELRDYIDIFKKQKQFFWVVVLIIVLSAVVWQQGQKVSYQATLLLNIGRTGVQDTTDYMYDGFYRLQADERFADTIVRWLTAPRVVEDIYANAGLDAKDLGTRDLKNLFDAKRLSSQVVEVTYADADTKTLGKISGAAAAVLNRYAESLNRENGDKSWFVVIGGDPVIRDARIPLPLAIQIGLALGLFVGFWTVLLRHYLQSSVSRKQ
ncbi:MAG: hypothetical protein WAW00_01250 [Candidatus Moraniibacteriota bacterium]